MRFEDKEVKIKKKLVLSDEEKNKLDNIRVDYNAIVLEIARLQMVSKAIINIKINDMVYLKCRLLGLIGDDSRLEGINIVIDKSIDDDEFELLCSEGANHDSI